MMLQSIKAADYGDEMMLLALGNRSAVNYELKLYQVRAWVVSSHTGRHQGSTLLLGCSIFDCP